jgi:hypothetical protein
MARCVAISQVRYHFASRATLLSTSVIIHHFRVNARISLVDILRLDLPFMRRTRARHASAGLGSSI